MEFRFELDPREADRFVSGLVPRQELVYRLAIRGICPRCQGDQAFNQRTDALTKRFRSDMVAVLKQAAALAEWLEQKAATR